LRSQTTYAQVAVLAEQPAAADALQLTLRFSFQARLSRSVRQHESAFYLNFDTGEKAE
jgi:hypothetical protein